MPLFFLLREDSAGGVSSDKEEEEEEEEREEEAIWIRDHDLPHCPKEMREFVAKERAEKRIPVSNSRSSR